MCVCTLLPLSYWLTISKVGHTVSGASQSSCHVAGSSRPFSRPESTFAGSIPFPLSLSPLHRQKFPTFSHLLGSFFLSLCPSSSLILVLFINFACIVFIVCVCVHICLTPFAHLKACVCVCAVLLIFCLHSYVNIADFADASHVHKVDVCVCGRHPRAAQCVCILYSSCSSVWHIVI